MLNNKNNISQEYINALKDICNQIFPNSELLEWDYNNLERYKRNLKSQIKKNIIPHRF
jgi:hypothetical protein